MMPRPSADSTRCTPDSIEQRIGSSGAGWIDKRDATGVALVHELHAPPQEESKLRGGCNPERLAARRRGRVMPEPIAAGSGWMER
jgi:hypothetical protein